MVANRQVDPLDEGGVDVPALGGEHLLDTSSRAEDHPLAHTGQATTAVPFNDLGIEQRGLGQPTRLGYWSFGSTARRLHPLPKVGQQGGGIMLEPIGEKQ